MEIKFKKLTPEAVIPKRAHNGDAGLDLYLPREVMVLQGRQIIPLDFAIELPHGYCAEIQPRSGFASKGIECRMRPTSVTSSDADFRVKSRADADVIYGLIDENYRGCVGVIVNNNDRPFMLDTGTRIAQMVIRQVPETTFIEVSDLADSERGEGGFGSTGK